MTEPLTILLACIVVVEPFLVLFAAPRLTQRLNERRAVAVFDAHLLPRIKTVITEAIPTAEAVAAQVQSRLPALPSQEQQDAARAELAAAIGESVRLAVADVAQSKMAALSERGVDARASFAAREEAFLAAVAEHEKGGLVVLAALEQFKAMAPSTYKLAVRAGPEAVPNFLEKHGSKLTLGLGGKAKPKVPYIGGSG